LKKKKKKKKKMGGRTTKKPKTDGFRWFGHPKWPKSIKKKFRGFVGGLAKGPKPIHFYYYYFSPAMG
jgi:hypothetical protein